MISQITGLIIEKQPPQLILEVHGLGYEVDCPMSTFYQLPEIGHTIKLHTHFVVREDAHLLFGFYTEEERYLFRTLLKVNGVGPRLALTILSSISPNEFVRLISNNDTLSLVRVPGVGKKTAERLVIEMRDKLSNWQDLQPSVNLSTGGVESSRRQIINDAIAALVALGYKQPEANRIVTKIDGGQTTSEELIRLALREMM